MMIFAIVLILTWLILLIRYPRHALPILLLAALSIGLLALGVVWNEARNEQRLQRIALKLSYAPDTCPVQTPLQLTLNNPTQHNLLDVRFKVTAFAPEVSANLIQSGYAEQSLPSSQMIAAGATVTTCIAQPALRPGYRASSVRFNAHELKGRFD